MPRLELPDFALEVYFSRWEFTATHNLSASDAETLTVGELLALGDRGEADALRDLPLNYTPTWGTDALRRAIADTYERIEPADVLVFAGAQESLFWSMQLLLEPGDHAVVTVPNYQAFESVPLATGATVDGLPLWEDSGGGLRWSFDLDRLRSLLRPETRLVAVNFPNNPTGFVPDRTTWLAFVELCDERGIRVISDEVYRGIERDPDRTLPQAADLSERALSINVLSKAYGLPGLRIGWVASRDREALARLERGKHYTSISQPGPSELLAALALRHRDTILSRNRELVRTNAELVEAFAGEHGELFDYTSPDGGCVTFPRYLGADGVEEFCRRAVEDAGVFLVPASIFRSDLATVPDDRFRIGIGRRQVPGGLDRLRTHIADRLPHR
ncbi:MAG: aminotransferase class I/II-fold pyridoxal phosphate-dependent enzyme [Actinomycetota bacterium]